MSQEVDASDNPYYMTLVNDRPKVDEMMAEIARFREGVERFTSMKTWTKFKTVRHNMVSTVLIGQFELIEFCRSCNSSGDVFFVRVLSCTSKI